MRKLFDGRLLPGRIVGSKSPHADGIEHDTLAESPAESPAAAPETPVEDAPARQPWCSHDNSEIWSFLVGDEDDE